MIQNNCICLAPKTIVNFNLMGWKLGLHQQAVDLPQLTEFYRLVHKKFFFSRVNLWEQNFSFGVVLLPKLHICVWVRVEALVLYLISDFTRRWYFLKRVVGPCFHRFISPVTEISKKNFGLQQSPALVFLTNLRCVSCRFILITSHSSSLEFGRKRGWRKWRSLSYRESFFS